MDGRVSVPVNEQQLTVFDMFRRADASFHGFFGVEAGGEMAHVVKLVVYITDIRHREAVYRTMGEYIKGVHPVCTGLVVQALARPEWLVEIDATAVIPDED